VVGGVATVAVLRAALAEETVNANPANARLRATSSTAHTVLGGGAGRSGDSRRRGTGRRRAGRSGGRVAVPVFLGILHTLAHGDSPETLSVEVVEHVYGEVLGGQLVDVMADDKPITVVWVSGITGINALLEIVLGDLNLLGSQLVVVIGIEVKV